MSCRVSIWRGQVVLVSHNPTIAVFTTTEEHLDSIEKKPDGHYEREHLMGLVEDGHAVVYEEDVVRPIAHALETLIFGCPRE
jgi:hypothetical protein